MIKKIAKILRKKITFFIWNSLNQLLKILLPKQYPTDTVIVSLTCTSYRFSTIHKVLDSIMNQSYEPTEIHLYLSKEAYLLDQGVKPADFSPELNKILKKNPKIKVFFTENNGPYRKILPTLRKHLKQDCLIITADDDVLYPFDWIERLVAKYRMNNVKVVAHRGRRIAYNGQVLPYNNMPIISSHHKPHLVSDDHIMPTGNHGILYHTRYFDERIFDQQFLSLCPTADDVWLHFFTLSLGFSAIMASPPKYFPLFFFDLSDYEMSLFKHNISAKRLNNDEQIQNAIKFFKIKNLEFFSR